MPGSADVVWSFLQNIEGVARCMPGAKLTERLDDTHFKGTVAVKVGPASMAFKGNIEVMGLDEAQRTLRLIGKGSDSSGTSGASLDLTARVEPGATPDSSNLIGKSEVSMSGKAAAFGGRMMGTVADQILNQFAGNFARQVGVVAAQAAAVRAAEAGPPITAPATAVPMAVGTPSTSGSTAAATAMSAAATAGLTAPATMPAPATAMPTAPATVSAPATALPTAPTTVPAPTTAIWTAPATVPNAPATMQKSTAAVTNDLPDEPANEINALALFWAIIREWFRGLFRRKPA